MLNKLNKRILKYMNENNATVSTHIIYDS